MGTSGYTNKPYHTTSWFLRLTNGTATAMFSITVDYQRCFFFIINFYRINQYTIIICLFALFQLFICIVIQFDVGLVKFNVCPQIDTLRDRLCLQHRYQTLRYFLLEQAYILHS